MPQDAGKFLRHSLPSAYFRVLVSRRGFIPRIKLTASSVRALEAVDKPQFYWDDALAGFGVKVTPKGKKVFVCQYRAGGGSSNPTRRMTIGGFGHLTPDQARTEAKRILGQVATGGDPAEEVQLKRREITVAQLCDKYLEGEACAAKKRSTVSTDKGRIERHIKPLLGSKKVSSVSRGDVKKFLHDVAEGRTAADIKTGKFGRARITGGRGTATRTVGLLGSIFTYACDLEIIETNPVRGIKRFPDRKMDRFLNERELTNLGAALADAEKKGHNPHALNIIRLLVFTGARRGEIETLKWREVDPENGLLNLEDSKTGQKTIRLNAPALQLLVGLPRFDESEFVFPAIKSTGHYTGTPKVWRDIREDAGFMDLRLHDLRHSFASMALRIGASLPVIGALLGHKNPATTQRYAHLSDDPLRSLSDAVGKRMSDALHASRAGS